MFAVWPSKVTPSTASVPSDVAVSYVTGVYVGVCDTLTDADVVDWGNAVVTGGAVTLK